MLKGLYTVLITPFLSSGELDEEGLRANIRFQKEKRHAHQRAERITGDEYGGSIPYSGLCISK